MSLIEIEAELKNLTQDELRRLAMRSWREFVAKETGTAHCCDEEDPLLLRALDEAVAEADGAPQQGLSATDVRTRLDRWTSR